MIQIESLDIRIRAFKAIDNEGLKSFGRHLDFNKGLNIVVGDNTTGKTTLVKCLFYAFGMEELYSTRKGPKSLDKSVCSSFEVKDGNKVEQWMVDSSCVVCKIRNTKGASIQLKRWIKSSNIENETNIINVTNWGNEENAKWKPYFIHSPNDHEEKSQFGFYQYLAKFAGLPLVDASNYAGEQRPIYLQTIFSLSFIEQTRGWGDFFATIKGFNIMQPRQRIIEYALELLPNTALSVNRQKKAQMLDIEKNLKNSIEQYQNWLALNNLRLSSTNVGDLKNGISLDHIELVLINERSNLTRKIDSEILRRSELQEKIKENFVHPKISQVENRLSELECKRNEYVAKLASDKAELNELRKRERYIANERIRIHSISKVKNAIHLLDVEECPYCHQRISVNLGNVNDTFDNIVSDNSAEELLKEEKFLTSMIKSLEESVEQQEVYQMYYDREIAMQKALCENICKEKGYEGNTLVSDAQYEMARIEMQIVQWNSIQENFNNFKNSLKEMQRKYDEIEESLIAEDDSHLTNLFTRHSSTFKQLLSTFGYNSNDQNRVFLSERQDSDRYLPEVQLYDGDSPIRNVSSASDFVRSIWAYYISLIMNSVRHPGFLVMDEPCQQSMKEQSLKKMFEVCADLNDRQIILFCSSQPNTEESKNAQFHNENVIDKLLCQLNRKDINELKIGERAIIPIENI